MTNFYKLKNLSAALLLCLLAFTPAYGQMQPMPVDPDVRIGKLENGLTYYIRHNAIPEGQTNFYIAQKVGSILEEDDQRGLAHFLEHMCFNGTKHFPGNRLREYLENIGVKFGTNLNAYTAVDETVYNIDNVPTSKVPEAIDSCLWILRDWADGLTLDEKEIDKERGVIHEEWRTRMSPVMRMYEKIFPIVYPDSRYAYRIPIGTMEVVDNFPYKALRDYYEKWYRPDQQGIIVVGDFDPEMMEQKVKEIFSSIKMPENAAERIYYPVADNKEPIACIATDKEQQNATIYYMSKHDAIPTEAKNDINYLGKIYADYMVSFMLSTRLQEIVQQSANPPFIYAGAYEDDYFVSKTKDAFMGYAVCKEDAVEQALTALARELERARRFGFTAGEYERAKANYLKQIENNYNERNKMKSTVYVQEYVRHFIDNEPIPGIENEYNIMNRIVPQIPVEAINQMLQELITDSNQVVTLLAPEKEGVVYPEKERLLEIIAQVKAEELEPYVDQTSNEPLMGKLPNPGKVAKSEEGAFGSTVYTLNNGATVIVKPTDFKADEIRMKAFSAGGTSLYPDSDIINLKVAAQVAELGGLSQFSNTDLQKILAGKMVQITPQITSLQEGVTASCSPKDLETLLQLTYLTFTSPRKDDAAFESFKNRNKAQLHNYELNPMSAFSDTLNVALYDHHPRAIDLKADMIDQIDYDRVIEIYKERFANAADFTFLFVGNVDSAAITKIAEYIGSLPANPKKENYIDHNLTPRKGVYTNHFTREMETPKSTVFLFISGDGKYTLKDQLVMSMLYQVMDMVYTESVREEEGGTYGVGIRGSLTRHPKKRANLQISFDTDPARRKEMTDIILQGLKDFAKQGPDAEKLARVKEFMLKTHQENQKENSYWMTCLENFYWNNQDNVSDYEKTLNSITAKDLRKYAKDLLKQGNLITVSINGEKKE